MQKLKGLLVRWLNWTGSGEFFYSRRLRMLFSPEMLCALLLMFTLGHPLNHLRSQVVDHFAPLPQAEPNEVIQLLKNIPYQELSAMMRRRSTISQLATLVLVTVLFTLAIFLCSRLRRWLGTVSWLGKKPVKTNETDE